MVNVIFLKFLAFYFMWQLSFIFRNKYEITIKENKISQKLTKKNQKIY